jgi:hypothetical protein
MAVTLCRELYRLGGYWYLDAGTQTYSDEATVIDFSRPAGLYNSV